MMASLILVVLYMIILEILFTLMINQIHYINTMDLKSIGLKLKDIRKKANLTQEKFAKKIDTKRSSISYYEIGKMMISTADLKQICETFGVSADYVVGNTDINIKREKKIKIKTKEIKEKIGI